MNAHNIEESILHWRHLRTAIMTEPSVIPDLDTQTNQLNVSVTSAPSDVEPVVSEDLTEVSYELVSTVVSDLKTNREKATHSNVLKQLSLKGLSENIANELIEFALEKQIIEEYRYNKQRSFRIPKLDTIEIEDPVNVRSTQTENDKDEICFTDVSNPQFITLDLFQEYKESMYSEINLLKENFRNELTDLKNEICILKKQLHHLPSPTNLCFPERNFPLPPTNTPQDEHIISLKEHNRFLQSLLIDKPSQQQNTSASIAQTRGNPPPIISASKNTTQKDDIPTPKSQPNNKKTISSVETKSSNINHHNKKTIEIIGDSMLLGINEKDIRDDNIIRVRPHSGAKSYDMVDLIKVTARRKPDAVVIHVGSNDFNNPNEKVKTQENMEEVFRHISKESPKTKIAYSLTFNRHDKKNPAETNRKIKQTNEEMKVLCRRYGVKIIDNSNMSRKMLGYKAWHPSNEGRDILVDNWYTFIETV